MNPNENINCDEGRCTFSGGEVKIYRGGPRVLVLCNKCWAHESARRRHRTGYQIVSWSQGELPQPDGGQARGGVSAGPPKPGVA